MTPPEDTTDDGSNDDGSNDRSNDADRGGAQKGPSARGTSSGDLAEAEIISLPNRSGRLNGEDASSPEHLVANRKFIVRRALLASAVGGIVPLPVMDDYLAGRIRAGMLMQIAERRHVDLAPSSAELLADPREGSAVRNATMTAATLLALKLAWRKFFMLVAAGRRAEEMTTTFQVGTLFDHFCTRLHVGAGVNRPTAIQLRSAIFSAIHETERAASVAAFTEGGRTLARSIGEAPSWVSRRLQKAVEQYVASGGNPDVLSKIETSEDGDGDAASGRWLDRAAGLVEARLESIGTQYQDALLANFERHWRHRKPATESEQNDASPTMGPPKGSGTPG